MIQKVTNTSDPQPLALAALRRAANQAIELARQTNTPAWVMEDETLLDATKSAPSENWECLRQKTIAALQTIGQRCGKPDWDGEGAQAVEPATCQTARRLLDALPNGYALPTIEPEPDGHLSLEWYRHPQRLLSVSVGPAGTLYWAALIGSEDPRGSCQFVDQFPQTLLYWIGQVYG